ncbi:MAG: hypothetical protein BMS9Abin37_2760 [Acidobacteriota bacterium]|nr:MAG: hypothetical protein BMS9Abin37_2760 [Acidobacteriota bacterium]
MPKRPSRAENFLSREEKHQVEAAIKKAEQKTSAEIKLVLASHCWGNIWDKAGSVFRKRGLKRTQERNAVLILLVTTNRELLIYGDEGIHQKAGQSLWDDVKEQMLAEFRQDDFVAGLTLGVERIGHKLAEFFPPRADDINEIPDGVVHEA